VSEESYIKTLNRDSVRKMLHATSKVALPHGKSFFEVGDGRVFFWYGIPRGMRLDEIQRHFKDFEYYATGGRSFPLKLTLEYSPSLTYLNKEKQMFLHGGSAFSKSDVDALIGKPVGSVERKTHVKDLLLSLKGVWDSGRVL
jgi:hypothetical protein